MGLHIALLYTCKEIISKRWENTGYNDVAHYIKKSKNLP